MDEQTLYRALIRMIQPDQSTVDPGIAQQLAAIRATIQPQQNGASMGYQPQAQPNVPLPDPNKPGFKGVLHAAEDAGTSWLLSELRKRLGFGGGDASLNSMTSGDGF